jgi:PHP family Zn ribbon phosphoesterase
MSKKIETVCDNCSSQFELKFNEDLVKEHEEIYCPFCGTLIEESVEEDIEEYKDDEQSFIEYIQEDMWD